MACSDHDERVAKVGPAMRITELEAKSKGKHHAARFFILRAVWRLSITYYLLMIFERACPQAQCKHKALHVQPNPFSQSSCIRVLVEIGSLILLQRFVAENATRHYRTSQLTPQDQKIWHHKQIRNQDNIDQIMIGIISSLGHGGMTPCNKR